MKGTYEHRFIEIFEKVFKIHLQAWKSKIHKLPITNTRIDSQYRSPYTPVVI